MAKFVSSSKQTVGVAVTPGVGVEVALLDKKSLTVVKYGRRPLDYNLMTREIQDYSVFKATIVELFKELDINLKSNVDLVLPNVHLDFETLPLIIGDEAINNAVLSKAEDSYVFKRVEPVSSWTDLVTNANTDKRLIVYTSFQETAVSQVKEIFTSLGATLVGIESSYPAIIRSLWFTGALGFDVDEDTNWNLLLVNSNSYALFCMQGSRLIDFKEVPLAIKSFSYEEAYQAISTSISQILPSFPAKKLFILSQSEEICSEVLRTQIIFDEEVITHDCNKYSKNPPVDVIPSVSMSEASVMTYGLLGALVYDHMENIILDLNFLRKTNSSGDAYFTFKFKQNEIAVTQEVARKAMLAIAGIIALICLSIYYILNTVETNVKKQVSEYQNKVNETQQQINEIMGQGGVVSIDTLIDRIININKDAMSFYDSIATDIPQSVWLQYYYNKDGDKVALEGVSANIEDIYNYYKSLKVISPKSSIKLNRLQILNEINGETLDLAAPDDGTKFYDFEISNVKSPKSNLKLPEGKQEGDSQNQQQGNNSDAAPTNALVPVDINN